MDYYAIINDPRVSGEERLAALAHIAPETESLPTTGEINNHIHTIYSFSPYTPSMAALRARESGLEAAGSVDHDSIAAAEEMLAACSTLGIGGCVGFEVRVSFKHCAAGAFAERKINNPDSAGIAYMTVQGIPKPQIPAVKAFLSPIQRNRLSRTMAMTNVANGILYAAGFEPIDFKTDIAGISQYAGGGEITERHLLAAVADKIIIRYEKGEALTAGITESLGINPPVKITALLSDPENPHYLYDLLGLLKTTFLPRIFIQPDENECIPAQDVVHFANSIGAIPAYAYLGDVGDSPTGDKKAEKFEDEYLDELCVELSSLGYKAITYMPPRNTREQLQRVQKLCRDYGFMEISGVDINSSRQSFTCKEVVLPEFRHLVDTTWALIAHERLASISADYALFADTNPFVSLPLQERLSLYAQYGRSLDWYHPEDSALKIVGNTKK
ncbi:hypothetical protein FACS1894172_13360 [Spirochaetia bacterium]|nr:hypothetical protein FACS1894164_10800 [Spirochaetia bacterium]GHU33901.1 hypothetical protein FACS1894172_13360 [Spirochaetia bacterium]